MARTQNLLLDKAEAGSTTAAELIKIFNDNMEKLDNHNHGSGNGRSVPTSGLTGDGDILMGNNTVGELKGLGLLSSAEDSLLNNSIFAKDGNLYTRDGAGRVIQLTGDGAVTSATVSVEKRSDLIWGFGAVESTLDITQAVANSIAVTAFGVPSSRNAKTADYVRLGSYLSFTAPAASGFHRPWFAVLNTDLQASTIVYNAEDFNLDNQWVVAAASSSIGAADYRLFSRKVPLAQNESYACVVRSFA